MKTADQMVAPAFDVRRVRGDFPILHQLVHDRPLVYLDNAATTHKPRPVIEAIEHFYTRDNSNIHRGLHALSERATFAYERSRGKVRRFLNAEDNCEIIFTRGATEAINLVAASWGRANLRPGDEIVISTMEHHSNIVPWQLICEATGAVLKIVPITDSGEFMFDEYLKLLGPRTRLVSVVQMSNSLGTINPVRRIADAAHELKVPVLVDGAQGAPHLKVDVQALGCDFFAFSSHKVYAPTGLGVLYGRAELLEAMPPYQGGGDMISSVSFKKTTFNKIPHKFEAGTPHIAGAIGLGAAIDYLDSLGYEGRAAHEEDLLDYATKSLSKIKGLTIIGTAPKKGSVVSFTLDDIHPHDIGTILDKQGIAVRAGHHCTQPLMERLGLPATARASFSFYNTRDEVDALVTGIHRVFEVFR